VFIPLRFDKPLKSRDVVVEFKKTHLKVGVRGLEPIIDGQLHDEIKIDSSTWVLEDNKNVSTTLQKVS
jgi:hypothetical protein